MKKTVLALALVFLCSLSGFCAQILNVYCTTYPVWLLTREITRGLKDVRTDLLIPAGTGCPHDYILTPADLRKLQRKNIIVVRNGLGLDDFVLKMLAKVNPESRIITACTEKMAMAYSGCEKKDKEHKNCHHHHEHSHANAHLFASPDKALEMVSVITEGLCKADPAHSSSYTLNSRRMQQELRRLIRRMELLRNQVRGKAVVVQHDIFQYLFHFLEIRIAAEIQGEGHSPSAAEMRQLAGSIRRNRVAVIFTEPQFSSRSADLLARECRIRVCKLDPLANGPVNPPPGYYVRVMNENLSKIGSVLGR